MLRIELSDCDTAQCGEYRVTARYGSVIGKLARVMLGDEVASETLVEVWRDGTPVFAAKQLGWWGKRSISEGDQGLRVKPYQQKPHFWG